MEIKKYKNIIFDLDGTLIVNDANNFLKHYFPSVKNFFNKIGHDGKKIVNLLIESIPMLEKNDGKITNYKMMFDHITNHSNYTYEELDALFMRYYQETYDEISSLTTQKMPYSFEILEELNKKGYNLFLFTNSFFPRIAIEKRLAWGGLKPDYFKYITTYDNSSYCKPNPNYYIEAINKLGLNINESLMVGNNVLEDGIVETIGLDLYLIEDQKLNDSNLPETFKYKSLQDKFYEFVKKLPNLNKLNK